MPLCYERNINEATKIGVWHITEPEEFFLDKVSVQREITHPHKRLQHLAGRYLLKYLFPEFPLSLILIADTRKPFLKDEVFHFSISHCGDYAAVIVSKSNRVGVDIEIPQAKIEKIKHKFLSPAEQEIIHAFSVEQKIEGAHQTLTMAWGVKEAVFKWYGAGAVDFIHHIRIESLRQEGQRFIATCIFNKEQETKLVVHSKLIDGNNLSIILT